MSKGISKRHVFFLQTRGKGRQVVVSGGWRLEKAIYGMSGGGRGYVYIARKSFGLTETASLLFTQFHN